MQRSLAKIRALERALAGRQVDQHKKRRQVAALQSTALVPSKGIPPRMSNLSQNLTVLVIWAAITTHHDFALNDFAIPLFDPDPNQKGKIMGGKIIGKKRFCGRVSEELGL